MKSTKDQRIGGRSMARQHDQVERDGKCSTWLCGHRANGKCIFKIRPLNADHRNATRARLLRKGYRPGTWMRVGIGWRGTGKKRTYGWSKWR